MPPKKRKSTRKSVDEDSAVPFKKYVVKPSGEGESQDDLPLSQDSVVSMDRDLLSIDCLKLLAEKGFADVATIPTPCGSDLGEILLRYHLLAI